MGHQSLRIIGGKHRGRALSFVQAEGLRPTPDRIRETLFNWLQPVISGSRCLDMFAGSGLLGLEALSRGAGEVVFIEQQKSAVTVLEDNISKLGLDNASVVSGDAFERIESFDHAFDIVFLDPPFHKGLLPRAMQRLSDCRLLKPSARIYIESEAVITDGDLPGGWEIIRAKKAGQVFYHLATTT